MLNMRIAEEDALRLDNLSKKTHRPKSFYVRKLIHDNLANIENIYLSEKKAEELRAVKTRIYLADEVKKEIMKGRLKISIQPERNKKLR